MTFIGSVTYHLICGGRQVCQFTEIAKSQIHQNAKAICMDLKALRFEINLY